MVNSHDQTEPVPAEPPATQRVFAAETFNGPVPDIRLIDRSCATVAAWLEASSAVNESKSAKLKWDRLAQILRDDSVKRLQELAEIAFNSGGSFQAVKALKELDVQSNKALPKSVQLGAYLGATLGQAIPAPSVPALRSQLRKLLGFYLTPLKTNTLRVRCADLAAQNTPASVKLLLSHPVSDQERDQLCERWQQLIRQLDVTELLINPALLARASAPWDLATPVAEICELLRPVLRSAAADDTVIIFDSNNRREFEINRLVFEKLLPEAEFMTMRAGLTVPAQLPHAPLLIKEFADWATVRVDLGGAPIRLRLSRSADFQSDSVAAASLALAPGVFTSENEIAANYLRCLNQTITASSMRVMRVTASSNDPFDTAFALALAAERKLSHRLTVEHVSGVNPALNQAMIPDALAQGARVRLRLNVFPAHGLDQAIRLELPELSSLARTSPALIAEAKLSGDASGDDSGPAEVGQPQFLDAIELAFNGQLSRHDLRARHFERGGSEITREPAAALGQNELDENLTRAVISIAQEHHGSVASLNETGQLPVLGEFFAGHEFVETAIFASHQIKPDEDPLGALPPRGHAYADGLVASERARYRRILAELDLRGSAGLVPVSIEDAAAAVRRGRKLWLDLPRGERAELIRASARLLSHRRDEVVSAVIADAGVVFAEAERELSAAISSADRYLQACLEFDSLAGVRFEPMPVLLLDLDPSQPLSSLSAALFAALAAGTPVLLRNGAAAAATVAVLLRLLGDAQLPEGVLVALEPGVSDVEIASELPELELLWSLLGSAEPFVPDAAEVSFGQSNDDVDSAVATDLSSPLSEPVPDPNFKDEFTFARAYSEISQNAAIIMPSANLRDAAAALVLSAFGASGRHNNRLGLAIVVGSTSRNTDFSAALMSAVRELRPGAVDDPATTLAPLAVPLNPSQTLALTQLGDGERWALTPELIAQHPDAELWSPGVRVGVSVDSEFYRKAAAVPVLGVMFARTLNQAISIQNSLSNASAAALFTRDSAEAASWLQTANAPSLYLNTATIPEGILLEPAGLARASGFAPQLRQGDPDAALRLGSWSEVPDPDQSSTLHLRGLDSKIVNIIETAQAALYFDDFEWLRQGALSDALWWSRRYGQISEYAQLGAARKLLRYRPKGQVTVRPSSQTELREVMRAILAGVRSGSTLTLSLAEDPLHDELREVLEAHGVSIRLESLTELSQNLEPQSTIRLIGPESFGELSQLRELAPQAQVFAVAGSASVSGRVELLPFLAAQTISLPLYQDGTAADWSWQLI